MAMITFTRADVARLLRLPSTRAVEDLITRRVLDVSAHTRRGQPLFDVDAVRHAADVITAAEPPPPSRSAS